MTAPLVASRVAEAISTLMPELRSVDVHEGEITKETIDRVQKGAPGVLVSVVKIGDVQPVPGGANAVAYVVLLVSARSSGSGEDFRTASEVGFALVATLCTHIPRFQLGEGTAMPRDLEFVDVTDPQDQRLSGQVVLGSFRVPILIEDPVETGLLSDVLYSFAPEVGPEHEAEYRSVHGEGFTVGV